jgi:nucleoid-associated protein YgaU
LIRLTVTGGNLFQIAAATLGDAMQWINIAQANSIGDPFIEGQTDLIMPNASSAFAGGIGLQ